MKLGRATGYGLLVAGALMSAAGAAKADIKVGLLKCQVESGFGYIIGSSKELSCRFERMGGLNEHYAGKIIKLGADVGFAGKGNLIWAVFAPSQDVEYGALSGTYVGAAAEASAGVGLGANVLIGGWQRSVNLQPVSVSAHTGFNAAGGFGAIMLTGIRK